MARKFIATILAAALAISAFSLPARAASEKDIIKLLAGAAAIAIIGKAIKDGRDREREAVTRQRTQTVRPQYVRPGYRNDRGRGHAHDRNRHDRGYVDQTRRMVIPSSCKVRVGTRAGTLDGYDYRCLQRNVSFADRLPGRCVVAADATRGPRFVYSSRCLAGEGFVLG